MILPLMSMREDNRIELNAHLLSKLKKTMKNRIASLCCIYLILISLISCAKKNEAIETVKNAPTTMSMDKRNSFVELVTFIAGNDSDIEWTSFTPGDNNSSDNISVQVDITRKIHDIHSIIIQHLLNRKTGKIKTGTIEVDGKKVGLDGWFEILLKIYYQKNFK